MKHQPLEVCILLCEFGRERGGTHWPTVLRNANKLNQLKANRGKKIYKAEYCKMTD